MYEIRINKQTEIITTGSELNFEDTKSKFDKKYPVKEYRSNLLVK